MRGRLIPKMKQSATNNWKGVTGGSNIGQKGMILLFHLFSVTFCYVILALAIPFYFLFAAKGRNAIYRYFRDRFHYSRFKSFRKTFVNHFIFGQCLLDRFAVYAGKMNFFDLEIVGNEHFMTLIEGEKGFIIASSHIGNFELNGYLLRQEKKHINAVIFGGETEEVMKNRTKITSKNNISLIPVLPDMSHLFQINNALGKGEIISMPCDRTFGSAKSVECDFLGGKADFPIGAFTLAATFDVPVITIFTIKKNYRKYITYVKPVVADYPQGASNKLKAEYLTRAFVRNLEEILRQYPEQWFNFYDFWK